MRAWHYVWRALVTIGISLGATWLMVWLQPGQAITLLVYLPGIAIVEAWFGGGYGWASVLLSVAGSSIYRIWFFPSQVGFAPRFHVTWEKELILLVVGLFVVALMERNRKGRSREEGGARQLAAVLDNVSDAVLIFNREFRVEAMNRAAHAMLDHPGETLVGERAEDLEKRFRFEADTPGARPALTLEETSRAGIAVHVQGVVQDASRGWRVQVLVHAVPRQSSTGEVLGAVVVVTNLTAIKDLQMRLLDSARQAALGKMVSGLSHDFNHALDIIRRAIAVLELHENAPLEDRRRYRAMIDSAAVEGSQMVRRMRDFLAGGGDLNGKVDMAQVAREAIELTQPLWRNRSGIEVQAELQPVPAVAGNANDLQRVLVNLLFNAIEALGTAGGRITVHTEADEARVRVWVEDTGPGIAPELLPHLFQAYFTTKPQGMGLGLYSSVEIVRRQGGSLRVASQPGQGARFTVEMPRAPGSEQWTVNSGQ